VKKGDNFDLQRYQNFPLFFTGRKLHLPGTKIEATAISCSAECRGL